MSLSPMLHLAQCLFSPRDLRRPYVVYVNHRAAPPILALSPISASSPISAVSPIRLRRGIDRISDLCAQLLAALAVARRAMKLALVYSVPLATAPVCLLGQQDRATREWWWASLRAAVNAAGPCSMKFAQWAATRVDLFPEEMCKELSLLHYQAKTHPWKYTEQVLDKRNPNWRQEWEFLNYKRPVGSGCVAQVYKAKIDGQLVAVKVVHPRVRQEIREDVEIMQAVTSFVEWWPRWQYLSLRESVDEFANLMTRQLNMKDEADNLARFRRYHNSPRAGSDDGMALADGNDDSNDDDLSKYDVVFPRPWLQLTSEDVLVESYHEGVHMAELLRSADTATRKELARKGLRAFLKMLFEDNFVHADLHPGNILVCNRQFEPSEDGISLPFTSSQDHQLVFLDVGLVTSLNDYDRRSFIELFQAVIKGNGYKVGRLMIERSRGGRSFGTDEHAFCTDMEMVVDEVLSRGFSLGKVHFSELLERVLKMCYVHKVKLESHFTNILLSFAIVEAMGRRLDPEMDILKTAAPYVFTAARKYKRMV